MAEFFGATLSLGVMNIARNDDWIVPLQYLDETGAPVPLLGSTLALMIRVTEGDATALVAINSPDNGITIIDGAQGLFRLEILREDSAKLEAGTYVADIVRTDADGLAERLWAGDCFVGRGVTRLHPPGVDQ
jgi:hypothetical protein